MSTLPVSRINQIRSAGGQGFTSPRVDAEHTDTAHPVGWAPGGHDHLHVTTSPGVVHVNLVNVEIALTPREAVEHAVAVLRAITEAEEGFSC
jgi:hypothetical protein